MNDITALDPNPVTFTVSAVSADYPSTISATTDFTFEIKHICEGATFEIDIPERGSGIEMEYWAHELTTINVGLTLTYNEVLLTDCGDYSISLDKDYGS